MKCPFCQNEDTRVIDKRETADSDVTRRRRECLKCEKRFTTYERVETDLVVIKKDGKRESFDRDKVKAGIKKACEKRPVTTDQIEKVMNDIESELRGRKGAEIPSRIVGNLVMKKLKRLDQVAYIRFASVYKEFADLESFEEELKKLVKK